LPQLKNLKDCKTAGIAWNCKRNEKLDMTGIETKQKPFQVECKRLCLGV
jgi:hypothetical protein